MNQINKTNQINQITRQTGLVPHVQTIEVFACQNSFFISCYVKKSISVS
jgi:hypothetical protein